VNHRQVAQFSIDMNQIRQEPEVVAQVFAMLGAVVVRAEAVFHKRTVDYFAISERFEEVEEGSVPPEVQIHVTQDENKNVVSVEVLPVDD
jgi:hypothetical protein